MCETDGVCVCVCERERETDRHTDRECMCVCVRDRERLYVCERANVQENQSAKCIWNKFDVVWVICLMAYQLLMGYLMLKFD